VIADTDKHSEDKVERFEEGRTCAAPGNRNNPEWSIVKASHIPSIARSHQTWLLCEAKNQRTLAGFSGWGWFVAGIWFSQPMLADQTQVW
jgi:hypothetical protein